ncbi:erythromycin esterase family protein [Ammoniphilus sp. YIM 78166]|uniref:erythromycin esterase family protein n=1 Tax=Ammoniphilus sp. YIM 78166 TaxID=1644106 RepID=UPI00106F3281|nr:erythromycin esterase family protein [Ammoniphilus sp. YIM 78166]
MNSQFWIEQIQQRAIPLEEPDDLDVLVQAIGDRPFVLLGEASHGTSEFYTIRAELTKRLIKEKGFSVVAVEGDWPSCYEINRYIRDYPNTALSTQEVLQAFNRWPTWMWANQETAELIDWLREHNRSQENTKAGFYGLDVYSLWESMEEIVRYLEKIGSTDLFLARKAFECFEPFARSVQSYGVSAAFLSEDCEKEVVALLQELRRNRKTYHEEEASINMEINALVAVNAERYYRSMVRGGPESWNIRDHHMVQVLAKLREFHQAKIIVWEHNTHIGDARATDMAIEGMVNVGQLVREQYGKEQVFSIGFGTHRGSVIAARSWAAPLESMPVPQAIDGSWEDLMHRAGNRDQILLFDEDMPSFDEPIGHRAIGVVYHPEDERGNYVPSAMALRYDAFVFIDETEALKPLDVEVALT